MDQLSRLSFTSTMILIFQQARYCIASIDGDPPVPAPTCGFGEPVHCFAAIRLCPKSPSTVKQPPGKVTAHCIDPQLPRFSLRCTRWYMGTRMPNAQEVPM
ncbi:hypothetical protein PAPYR_9623 [Paratrimastix pyriformis]|uniref:Secreted protein n=1 Tax=Paratrimastix pyriformis TaxID=342808 RepID=A0ABQ8UCM7_9EUKA|nr:hypothetical protein PAPYR_9623 [Paratrimastix pyriformis]